MKNSIKHEGECFNAAHVAGQKKAAFIEAENKRVYQEDPEEERKRKLGEAHDLCTAHVKGSQPETQPAPAPAAPEKEKTK